MVDGSATRKLCEGTHVVVRILRKVKWLQPRSVTPLKAKAFSCLVQPSLSPHQLAGAASRLFLSLHYSLEQPDESLSLHHYSLEQPAKSLSSTLRRRQEGVARRCCSCRSAAARSIANRRLPRPAGRECPPRRRGIMNPLHCCCC